MQSVDDTLRMCPSHFIAVIKSGSHAASNAEVAREIIHGQPLVDHGSYPASRLRVIAERSASNSFIRRVDSPMTAATSAFTAAAD
jgi:hypothetical protein